jgi:hypothetical protein
MEFDRRVLIGLGVLLALVVLYFVVYKKGKPSSPSSDDKKQSGKNSTVYGVMTCPYTVKQVEKYPEYDFVDCSGGKCPDFVSAFPTTQHPDGKIEVGFS